ncbi:MAG: bifunctional diaminohydroxyphosphoribosylaminopyrimidine deaminase/5-amino-6-(5-phosphoribosylamino)uracil reductase RibD [Lentisphaerae bacterium]|nr:bifunctional diaminohydroxyphosphoribosylaminopyrimidine deaminase/5-amino-6-(5-phosphoribosylamino)uracil reductase RibD [Lentisphaerota bacterium]
MDSDDQWMARAIALARRAEGLTRPNPPVGAVVVRNGKAVGEGYHRKAGGPHAEVIALRMADRLARGATVYISLEPCSTFGRTPPCTDALIEAGVGRVVVSVLDPNPIHRGRGVRLLRRAGMEVSIGVLENHGNETIAPFACWIRNHRPFVTLKMAMSLDARIAGADGRSKWITGSRARAAVQELRSRADAIMVGVGTVLADNPSLICRSRRTRRPARVVVDSLCRTPVRARMLRESGGGRVIIAAGPDAPAARVKALRGAGAAVTVMPASAPGRIDLHALMRMLGKEGYLHVLCEGGGALAGSLVSSGLVDELWTFIAPILLGGGTAKPAFDMEGRPLSSALDLDIIEHVRFCKDLLIRAKPRITGRTRHVHGTC